MRISLAQPSRIRVETFNLSNGADTVLQLLDANGTLVVLDDGTKLENDNAAVARPFEITPCGNRREEIPQVYFDQGINNGSRLASTITTGLIPLAAGTYYAKVTSRDTFNPIGQNLAAGKTGSYDFIVTLQ
jgi:hypothetical protein